LADRREQQELPALDALHDELCGWNVAAGHADDPRDV
jgi:hypothetical protein